MPRPDAPAAGHSFAGAKAGGRAQQSGRASLSATKNPRRAYVFGLLTVGLWSTVASAFKLTLEHLGPARLVLAASLASVLTLALVLAARGALGAAVAGLPRHLGRSLAMGALNPLLYYVVLFEAYDRLPAQEAQPLNYTWALTLSLLAIPLLGQRMTRWDVLAGLVCYSGVWVIATRGDLFSLRFEDGAGVLLALGSTVIWALYWIYGTRDRRDPVTGLFQNFLAALPLVAVYCVLVEPLAFPWPGLAGAAYVGVFEMGLAFVFWLTALRHAENASRVANLIFLAPFLSLVLIHFLVGETIRMSTMGGLVLIVAGLVFQQLKARQQAGPLP